MLYRQRRPFRERIALLEIIYDVTGECRTTGTMDNWYHAIFYMKLKQFDYII